MDKEFLAFTVKYKGIARALITHCDVAAAHSLPKPDDTPPPFAEFKALWDTGATNSVITQNVINLLGLKPTGKTKTRHAQGESESYIFYVNLALPNRVVMPNIQVTEGVLGDLDVLIGMDIISQGDFSITNAGGNTTFSFRVPSCKEVDYVKEHPSSKLQPAKTENKIGRNDPCYCGSGEKYKKCHGK